MVSPFHAPTLPLPRFDRLADGRVVVVGWGQLDRLALRPGDELLIGAPAAEHPLVLLPRGRGRPMLGRRDGRQLVALPGAVAVSEARWRVEGGVRGVERAVERGGPEAGTWHLAVRLVAVTPQADLAAAAAELPDGAVLDARQLDAACLRASVLRVRHGCAAALAAAPDAAVARSLLGDAPLDRLRLALPPGAGGAGGRTPRAPGLDRGAAPGPFGPRPVPRAEDPVPPRRQVLLPFAADRAAAGR